MAAVATTRSGQKGLLERAGRHSIAFPSGEGNAILGAVGPEWPLAGRTAELRRLVGLLTESQSRGVIIAGLAGVGKSRLAAEGLQLLERRGFATARVTATRSASSLPFGALAPLLPSGRYEMAGLADDRADLLRRSAAALVERAGDRRLVVFVDDAHLLDDASATLIHQLAVTGTAAVLLTIRSGEPAPDSVVALWKDHVAERIDLLGLPAEAISELLASVLGGPVDPATALQLGVRCEGVALFLRELVLGALEDGTLCDEGGIWRLRGSLAPSDRLVEIVENRLGELSQEERDILEAVSLAEPLGPGELSVLGDLAIAEKLERKGLLSSSVDGRRLEVRVAHPVYGDVVRRRTPAVRRRVLARTLADLVEAAGARRREDKLRVATWSLDGGKASPDIMLEAATIARWRYDFPLAERLARAAAAAGAGFDAALLAAQVTSLQGRGEEAEAELRVLAGQATEDAHRGLIAVSRLDNLALYLGRLDEGLAVAKDSESQIADPAWRDEIAARRSTIVIGIDGPRAAAEIAEPLLDRVSGRALVWSCLVAGFSLGRLGRLEAASQASARGYAAHLNLAQPLEWYPWMHVFLRSQTLAFAGRLREAEGLARSQYEEAIAVQSSEAQAWFAWQLARVLTDRGHVASAAQHGREGAALFRQLGRPQFLHFCLPSLAQALAMGGRAEEAADAMRAFDGLGLPASVFHGVDPQVARAWVAAASSDLPRARRLLEEAVERAAGIGDIVGESTALHALARFGFAQDAAQSLTMLSDELEGEFVVARAAHSHSLAGSDHQQLLEVSKTFEVLGADLLAAEAAADAAVILRKLGRARLAAAAELRAGELRQLCEGAVTPALVQTRTRALLTPAEQATALLAAAGRSNRQIADELCISVRTVEGRLLHVYEKLGVTGRSELAAVLAGPTSGG